MSAEVLETAIAGTDCRVIIAKRVGRLANRIVLFAHFIAAAAEHGFTVLNPSFVRQARYFPATARTLLCQYPPGLRVPPLPGARYLLYYMFESRAGALAWRQRHGHDVGLIRLRRDQHLDLNSNAFLDVLRRHRTVLVQDWFFRNGANCERHRDIICSFFTPV